MRLANSKMGNKKRLLYSCAQMTWKPRKKTATNNEGEVPSLHFIAKAQRKEQTTNISNIII